MHSTISLLALLGAVSAMPQNYLQQRGAYGWGTGVSSIPASSSSAPPYPSSSSITFITPTTYTAPTTSSSITFITPTTYTAPTTTHHHTTSILTGVPYTVTPKPSTVTSTVTRTITKFIPCSTKTIDHGSTWYTTWLSTSYITTQIVTTEVSKPTPYIVHPGHHGHHECECPARATVTETVHDHPITVTVTKAAPPPSKITFISGETLKTTTTSPWISGETLKTTSILTGETLKTTSTPCPSNLTGVVDKTTSILTGEVLKTTTAWSSTPASSSLPAPSTAYSGTP